MENCNLVFDVNGYLPNGFRVFVKNIPLSGIETAVADMVAATNKLIADGLTLHEPGVGELEPGEKTDSVGYVIRYDKENKRGTMSHWIGLYPANEAATKKYLWAYLDTPEDIEAFENATGIKVASMKVWPTNQAPERTPAMMDYIVKVKPGTLAVYKANPDWISEEKTKFEPKRIFIRWASETATATPTPQPPAATAPAVATGDNGKAEPARVSELVNEALTITRIEVRSDSAGWYGYGMFNDGVGSHEVRVNLFAPEDPKAITDAGYKWVTSGKVEWPVILAIKDNRTRIGSVVPKTTESAAKTIVSGFQTNLTQNGKPYLIFKYGDNYAYSYTREPFREAGYNVDGWDTVGIHEMPTPAELVCSWDKQQKHLIVDRVVMVDVFEKQVAS